MRKPNVKLLLGLVLGTVVTTIAIGVAHAFQYHRIADALRFQASRAEEQGLSDKVVRYLSRYLEFEPRDIEVREQLARVLASDAFAGSTKARNRAGRLLDEVLTRDPDRSDLRRLLAKVSLETGQWQMARKQLEILLPEKTALWPAGQKPPSPDAARGELEMFWGQLCQVEVRPEQAVRFYTQAIYDSPVEQLSYVRLAYLLRRLPESDPDVKAADEKKADELMQRLVENNPESHQAYLTRWRYRRDCGYLNVNGKLNEERLMEAAEDVAKALKRAPESVEVLLVASDLAQLRADVVAEKPIDAANLKAGQEHQVQQLKKYRKEARGYLEQGLKIQEKAGRGLDAEAVRRQLLWVLANLWIDEIDDVEPKTEEARHAEEEAPQLTERLRKTKGTNGTAPADVLQARMLMSSKKWGDAAQLLEHARPALLAQVELINRVDLYLGRCYQQMDEPNLALAAFQRVVDQDPQCTPARLGLADAKWKLRRPDEAMDEYRQMMTRDKVPVGGWIDLARLEIERQLQRDEKQRDWAVANHHIEQAAKEKPDNPDVTLLRAEVLLAQGKLSETQALLQTECDRNPKHPEYWIALATLASRCGKPYAELTILRDAEKAIGDRVELRLARARFWASRPDAKQRQEALAALKNNAEKLPADDQPRLLAGLAEAHYLAGDPASARQLLDEMALLPKYKSDLKLRLVLFDLSLKSDDEARMQTALDAIRAIEGEKGPYFLFGKALQNLWLVKERKETDKLPEVRKKLAEVEQLRPQWSRLFLARAEVEELAGETEAAIVDLHKAIDLGEDGPDPVRRLVELLKQQKRYDEAQAVMDRLRQSQRRNTQILRLGADLALDRGEFKTALEYARQAVPEDSKDWRDNLWRSQVLALTDQMDEAEKGFRKALAAKPDEPELWLALVHFLASQKRTAEAEATIKEATARIAADRVDLAVAQCYETMGFLDKAQPYFERALEKQPNEVTTIRAVARFYLQFGRLDVAKELLQKIINHEVPTATNQDVTWARHGLAVMLAASTDYRNFQEALGLVEMRLDESGTLKETKRESSRTGDDDLLARARVLSTQPQRRFREAAIEMFETASRAGRLDHGDQFILALLYDAGDNWPKASEQFRNLVLSRSKTPQYIAQYALRLIRQGELDAATKWVDRLCKLEEENSQPSGFYGTIELRARLLEKRGQGDKALDLLRTYVQRPRARPDEMLYLIASLGRQQRFNEAFDLCPEAWRKCPPQAAGGVTVALLRAMKPLTDNRVALAESWLKDAIEKHPEIMALRMHLADLYDLRGRYAESEKLYRFVLQKEPGNVIALNNLAWLLVKKKDGDNSAEALTLITKAVNGLGRRPDLLDTRALVYMKLNRVNEALADLKEATADTPTPTRLFHLAQAHQMAKDKNAAIKTMQEAKKLGLQTAALHPVEQGDCKLLMEKLQIK